jgi:peroxidase
MKMKVQRKHALPDHVPVDQVSNNYFILKPIIYYKYSLHSVECMNIFISLYIYIYMAINLSGATRRVVSRMNRADKIMGKYDSKLALVLRYCDNDINNLSNPAWGKPNTPLKRRAASSYGDGVSTLATRGISNPNPRTLSNSFCKYADFNASIPNKENLSDLTWIWGQFLDHEITLTEKNNAELAIIITPEIVDDANEDYPGRTILFPRSVNVINTSPREQPCQISAYISGTTIYSDKTNRTLELRLLDGSGKMKTTTATNSEVILPFNINEFYNAHPPGSNPGDFYLAGDIRANENIFLTAFHTLFVREHNRLCDEILTDNPELLNKDEIIFQMAKRIVVSLMQNITYNEYLPYLVGTLPQYGGYDDQTDSSIMTEFSTVGYRVGHSMLSSSLKTGPSTTMTLEDAFFNSDHIKQNGIDNLLLGGYSQVMQEIDGKLIEDVRSLLFGPPTADFLLDLAAFNIQRARDHGIPDYNTVRIAYGLARKNTFAEITSDTAVQTKLATLYDTVDDIDPWIGGIIEDHVEGAIVGELFKEIIKEQFIRTRNGDRHWFENNISLDNDTKDEIRNTTLSDVIKRNTGLTGVPDDVFKYVA